MALENIFTCLAVLFWVGIGAAIGVGWSAIRVATTLEDEPVHAPHAWMLGKPCWVNEYGDYRKYRVVAVSHKGAVAIREWDDLSGKHAKWIRKEQVEKGWLRFGESPYDTPAV